MAQTPNISNTPDNSMQALKEYGGYIVMVILLVLCGYFGWTYWQNNLARVDVVAADQYADIQKLNEKIILSQQNPDLDEQAKKALSDDQAKIEQDINTLVSTHGDSVYAWQALMIQARQYADSNDFQSANESLKKALAINLNDAGLHAITQLRYAQSLLASGNIDEALKIANHKVPSSFEGSKQELLGDIYMAKNDKPAAIQAYNNAWSLLSKRQEARAVLALKMESLGLSPEPIEPQESLIHTPTPMSVAPQMTQEQLAKIEAQLKAEAEASEAVSADGEAHQKIQNETQTETSSQAVDTDNSTDTEVVDKAGNIDN